MYDFILSKEAEKWFAAAVQEGDSSLGYLFIYREYLELIDMELAKEVNKTIAETNPIAAEKLDRIIAAYLAASKGKR